MNVETNEENEENDLSSSQFIPNQEVEENEETLGSCRLF